MRHTMHGLLMTLGLAQWLVLGARIPVSDNDESDPFEPFAHLKPENHPFSNLDYESSLQLHPQISVQSVFSDGIGTDDSNPMAHSHAFQVVVTLTGDNPADAQARIPLAAQKVKVKSQHDLPCIIEQGNGGLDDCSFGPTKASEFLTNNAGRFSFSIPLDGLRDLEDSLPPILIQTPFLKNDQWVVAHIDADVHTKISKLSKAQLEKMHQEVSSERAQDASDTIGHLMSGFSESYPSGASSDYLSHDRHHVLKRNLVVDQGQSSNLAYEEKMNYVGTYLISLPSFINLEKEHDFFKRSLPMRDILRKRMLNQPNSAFFSNAAKLELGNHTNLDIMALDRSEKEFALGTTDKEVILFTRQQDDHPWKEKLVNSVETAWRAVVRVLKKIGLTIKAVYNALVNSVSWEDISHTVAFLSLFYRKLAPLSLHGMDLIREKYLEMYHNFTDSTDDFFMRSLKNFGVDDLTFEKGRNIAMKLGNKTDHMGQRKGMLEADAKTLFLHDRIVNNIPNISVNSKEKSLFERLGKIMQEGASSLRDAVDLDDFVDKAPLHLKFKSHTSVAKMGLAKMINLMRSFVLGTEQFVGNVYAALIQLVPIYWNLAETIMLSPIKIPFVYDFWTKKFEGRSILSLLDILCFMGGIYGAWQYGLYHNWKGPFTRTDIEVLNSAPNPELLLYTWNHDPRTYAMDDKAKQEHRLGIYDWMQKCHVVVVWSLMNGLYDLALVAEDFLAAANPNHVASTVGNPGKLTYIPQVANSLFEMIGPIAQYPFTQLETDDPKEIYESIENPDSRYLGFWFSWVMELFVKAIRPFLGRDNRWNQEPLKPIVDLVLVAAPTSIFALKIQVDMAKGIAPDDIPRKEVIALGWIEIVGYYFEGFLPFVPNVFVGEMVKKYVLIAKHVAINVVNVIKNNILIKNNIVGMLSSSFQPLDNQAKR